MVSAIGGLSSFAICRCCAGLRRDDNIVHSLLIVWLSLLFCAQNWWFRCGLCGLLKGLFQMNLNTWNFSLLTRFCHISRSGERISSSPCSDLVRLLVTGLSLSMEKVVLLPEGLWSRIIWLVHPRHGPLSPYLTRFFVQWLVWKSGKDSTLQGEIRRCFTNYRQLQLFKGGYFDFGNPFSKRGVHNQGCSLECYYAGHSSDCWLVVRFTFKLFYFKTKCHS